MSMSKIPSPASCAAALIRAKNVLVATGIIFAISISGAAAQNSSTPAPPSAASDLVKQGQYLATAADCTACHTAPNGGEAFAGGYGISSPLGTIYSTNITPSKTFGIGNYSETDFARAIREGIRKDGTHLYPAMPYTSYAGLSDADVAALYAYFMQGVLPVDVPAPKTSLPFPFSMRFSMAAWNLLFLDNHRFQPDPSRSAQLNRGAYLVDDLEHCDACHTPRNLLMAEKQGSALSGGAVGSWYAPNITSDPVSGIGGWSQDELVQYLRTGNVPGKAQAAGPMAEAVADSLQFLPNDDLQAIAAYLKATAPIRTAEAKPRNAYGAAVAADATLNNGAGDMSSGAQLYSGNCASCHQATGAGTKDGAYPQLFQNTATGAAQPTNLIAAILFGVNRTVGANTAFMPAFGPGLGSMSTLSDQNVADVSNYVLQHFGNPNLTVTAQDVASVRQGGPPSTLAKLGSFALPGLIALGVLLLVLILWGIFRPRHRPIPG